MKGEVEAIETAAIQKNCQSVLQQVAHDKERAKEMKEKAEQAKKKQINPSSIAK